MEDAAMPYNPDADPTSRIQSAFEERYLDAEGVVGIGLGQTALGEDAILVYLRDKNAAALIPAKFEGLEVVTEVVGEIDAYDDPDT